MDIEKAVDQTRADHPNDECVVAYREGAEPLLLSLGEGLGKQTRAGAVLARMLAHPGGNGPFVIVAHRRIRYHAKRLEQYAADRIAAASRLVDMPLAAIVLSHGGKTSVLTSSEASAE